MLACYFDVCIKRVLKNVLPSDVMWAAPDITGAELTASAFTELDHRLNIYGKIKGILQASILTSLVASYELVTGWKRPIRERTPSVHLRRLRVTAG